MNATLVPLCALLLGACSLQAAAQGGSGKLDPGYGVGGRALVGHPRSGLNLTDRIALVSAIDAQGRVLHGGQANAANGVDDIATVVRFTANGQHDTSFGAGGYVELESPVADGSSQVTALAVDAQGGVLVVYSYSGELVGNAVRSRLCRLRDNGSIDPEFGNGGCSLINFSNQGVQESTRDMAVDADGDIFVLGNTDATNPRKLGIARFESDGTRDTCFGDLACQSGGIVTRDLALFDSHSGGDQMALTPDGRIAISLWGRVDGDMNADWWVLRLTSGGAIDTDFSGDGYAPAGFAFDFVSFPDDIVVRPNGRIVLAGNGSGILELFQFTTAGAPDGGFGVGGHASTWITDVNPSRGARLALQEDGKLLIAGIDMAESGGFRAGVIRLLTNGTHDPQFGFQGRRFIGFTDDADVDGEPDFLASDDPNAVYAHDGHIFIVGAHDHFNDYGKYAAMRLGMDDLFGDGLEGDAP